MSKGQDLYAEAKRLIPGGSNLFSKRAELHDPTGWPCYFQSARGAEVVDLDGRRYLDFSGASVGACVLGYRDEDVDQAVIRTISKGQTSSLLCPEEVELAKLLTLLHPWAQQVRYTRSGGEAITVAIRIAQAKTGRTGVGWKQGSYHGWHINDPREGKKSFINNDIRHWSAAAVIVEPSRLEEPDLEDLQQLQAYTKQRGIVLIFDEISSGFRRNLGGVHLHYGVTPDIAVFSKAISNGYPMAAVIGTEEVMSAAQNTFISSTTWSERIGPTAAIATIQKMWANDVFEHNTHIGELVKGAIEWNAKQTGLDVKVQGHPTMLHMTFPNDIMRTFYTSLMLERNILAGKDFYAMYAHSLEDCERFAAAVREVFEIMAETKAPQVEAAESGIR